MRGVYLWLGEEYLCEEVDFMLDKCISNLTVLEIFLAEKYVMKSFSSKDQGGNIGNFITKQQH